MDTRRFRDLLVWQRSMSLARNVYAMTESFPKSEMFGLTSQIRRAAVSIPSNIAEGRGRTTDKGFIVFLGHARGSFYELQTQVELAAGLGFVDDALAGKIVAEAGEISSMIHALPASLHSPG
jgi:four helix bundle protein